MAEPIKQTLFRFRTMRAPELISDEDKANYFIQHFDGETGVFFTAVAGMGPSDERPVVLAAAAEGFTDLKTVEEIKAVDADLYELGIYLLKNRNQITYAEADTAVGVLTGLNATELELIWDNLFYQTITLESVYAREACLVVLLAHHYVTNFGTVETTDEAARRWANSRVLMPYVLFGTDTEFTETDTFNEYATSFSLLSNAMEIAYDKLKLDQLETLKTEMATYKAAYYKTNDALEKQAIKDHMDAILVARGEATEDEEVDQFSGYTFKTHADYEAPVYEYVKPLEIDLDPIGEELTPESFSVLLDQRLNTTSTFEELESKLDKLSEDLTSSIFEKTQFTEEKIAIDGNLVTKCGVDKRSRKDYSYLLKLVPRATNKYSVYLVVDVNSSCLQFAEATSIITLSSGTTYKSTSGSNVNGILTVDLTQGVAIDTTGQTDVDIIAMLKFNNGFEISVSISSLLISTGQKTGVMNASLINDDVRNLQIPSRFGVRSLGISDYRKIEQTLCCYVPGEVSHIENIMAREYKERKTRRLRRQEDTTTVSSSREQENSTDTSTSTRFDMQSEISTVLSMSQESSQSKSFDGGLSAEIPLIDGIGANIGGGMSSDSSVSSSMEQSNSQSTSFAKDVTEKALQRVISKVTEERVKKIIEEFEETNQHGFDNRKGSAHISGVYRWVDKIYKNTMHNYGKRLQYEFMVPEPAEFHFISKASAAAGADTFPLVKPLDPRTNSFGVLSPIRNAAHIKRDNFNQWAARYGAVVSPPPRLYQYTGKTISRPDDGTSGWVPKTVTDTITIPEGYCIGAIFISYGVRDVYSWHTMDISAGGVSFRYYDNEANKLWFADSTAYPDLRYAQGSIPISVHFNNIMSGSVTFSVRMDRKFDVEQQWQLDTFNAIIEAYETRLAEYKNGLAEVEAKRAAMKDNPAYYREIEQTCLKKSCIAYLVGDAYLGKDFTVGHEVKNNHVNPSAAMDKYAAAAKFFEQAFDWNLINYEFYPFYWGSRQRWEEMYSSKNEDPLFKSFLSAGMARTIVPVRPGFEDAVLYYMRTGLIWNGGTVPLIDEPMFVSVINDLYEQESTVEETWETRVPSSLTVLQAKSISLEAEGLPCYCDTEELPVEEIVVPEVDPLAALDVFIEGDTNE